MAKTIQYGPALITVVKLDFECPKCTYLHTEKDYYKQYANSKKGFIYKKCKGCKTKLGISFDMHCDVVVWLKEDECT